LGNKMIFHRSRRSAAQRSTTVAPNNATVFSRLQPIVFKEALTRLEVEEVLKKFMSAVGSPLSYKGVILGHIKVSARLEGKNDFLFLSLTRLDKVDVKASPQWCPTDGAAIRNMELDINVLVFGHSIEMVEKIVCTSLQELQTSS